MTEHFPQSAPNGNKQEKSTVKIEIKRELTNLWRVRVGVGSLPIIVIEFSIDKDWKIREKSRLNENGDTNTFIDREAYKEVEKRMEQIVEEVRAEAPKRPSGESYQKPTQPDLPGLSKN